jgi:hypothetical protein
MRSYILRNNWGNNAPIPIALEPQIEPNLLTPEQENRNLEIRDQNRNSERLFTDQIIPEESSSESSTREHRPQNPPNSEPFSLNIVENQTTVPPPFVAMNPYVPTDGNSFFLNDEQNIDNLENLSEDTNPRLTQSFDLSSRILGESNIRREEELIREEGEVLQKSKNSDNGLKERNESEG